MIISCGLSRISAGIVLGLTCHLVIGQYPELRFTDSGILTQPAIRITAPGRSIDAFAVYYREGNEYAVQFEQKHAPWQSDFEIDGPRNTPGKAAMWMTVAFSNAESIRLPVGVIFDQNEDTYIVMLSCMDIIRFYMFDIAAVKLQIENGDETAWPISDQSAIRRCLAVLLKYTAFKK